MFRRFVLLGVLFVFLTGCKQQLPPVKLNDRIAGYNKKLFAASAAFNKAIAPLGLGQPVGVGNVRSMHDALKKELEDVQKDLDTISGNSYAGDDYIEAYKVFLDGQDKLVQQECNQIVQTVGDQTKTNAAKWAAIQTILKNIEKAEKADLDTLKKAQTTLADKSNFGVPPDPTPPPPAGGTGGPPRP